jgi:DNA helicase-2/ATP-dependent DNA helicase PcrA
MPGPLLNPSQWQAVRHSDGPLLILAGAGSGKTRVITVRVAELVRRGISAEDILVVTFTNKAADELRHRVEGLLSDQDTGDFSAAKSVPRWIGTFHSIGARLLRGLAPKIGLASHFPILDEDDQLKVCKDVLREENIDERIVPPRALRAHIDRAKNQGLLAKDFLGTDYFTDLLAKLYRRYEERLRHVGAVDFGDLLLLPVVLAENEPSVQDSLSRRFEHVLVDEFQDVNGVQYRLLKILARRTRNLAVVGDDDQAIYGWRGADVRLLLDFLRDWPDAQIVKLEENYRSSQVILDAAHAVVSQNGDRHEKRLFTRRDGGDPIVLFRARDDRAEARFVIETVLRMQADSGFFPEDFAVIYRTNAQSLRFEEALQSVGMPFSVLGGMRFFERAEIKDMVAYLRLCLSPDDELALRRVINVPSRHIGQTTVDKLLAWARADGASFWNTIRRAATEEGLVAKKKRQDLAQFVSLVEELGKRAEELSVSSLLQEVLERTGYRLMLSTGTPEDEARLQNLDALLGSIGEEERVAAATVAAFLAQPKPDDGEAFLSDPPTELKLSDYLARVSLQTGDENRKGKGVQLMTAHVAKGLEFPVVFVTGLEEGLFPSLRAGNPSLRENEDQRVGEERRLAYVAFTRAKTQLVLTCADQRWLWGAKMQPMDMSRFVKAIPRELLSEVEDRSGFRRGAVSEKTDVRKRAVRDGDADEAVWMQQIPQEDAEAPSFASTQAPASLISDSTRRSKAPFHHADIASRFPSQVTDTVSDRDRRFDSVGPSSDQATSAEPASDEGAMEVRVEYDGDVAPRTGQRVWHKTLGRGVVVDFSAFSAASSHPRAKVRFDDGQEKLVDARFLEFSSRNETEGM